MSKYIDADKAKNGVMEFVDEYGEIVGMFVNDFNILLERCAVDVQEVRHGRWITLDDEYIDECKCSSCGVLEYFNKGWKRFNYCPNCGSRMDLDGDTE